MEKTAEETAKRQMRYYSAQEKCRAVLSIWTERRKPSEVCREMAIKWALLSMWQQRALEGMLSALESRVKTQEKCPALSRRLQALLERRTDIPTVKTDLESCLEKVQRKKKRG